MSNNIESIDMAEELGRNFLTYAIDVDQNKSFPAVADGLLPGARAALWEMYYQKYTSKKPHVKSAKVASGVIGNWWPHNADATYGTLVRMAQPFIENNLEVDFQGAVGNIILGSDSAGSSRYTEMRLSDLAEEGLFYGIEKNCVEMIKNYTQDKEWPKVLPAIFPRLLVNGSIGLGVGMSQYFTQHNLRETAELIINYLQTGEIDEDNYYPDFPTGGTIINKDELSKINKTGKGRIIVEAKYVSNEKKHMITFTEFPYQVYIEETIQKIKDAYNAEKIVSIADIYNSSNKNGIGITVEVNPTYSNDYCLAELFQNSPLRSQYNVNQNAIINQIPELVNLKKIVKIYVEHNTTCIRLQFVNDFGITSTRIEILEGLLKAIANLEKVLELIKISDDPKEALKKGIGLSDNQVKAVLDMRLARLTKLENKKLEKELREKKEYAVYCKEVMESFDKQKEILIERLQKLAEKYGDKRRTEVVQKEIKKVSAGKTKEKIEEVPQDIVISYNSNGYIKAIPVAQYKKKGTLISEFKTTTKDLINVVSEKGFLYRLSIKDLGLSNINDKGKIVSTLIKIDKTDRVVAVFPSTENNKHPYLCMVTKNGFIKKIKISEIFSGKVRNLNGTSIMTLKDNDKIIYYCNSNGDNISILTRQNFEISFDLDSEVRSSGKKSQGVRAILLHEKDEVISCQINKNKISLQKRGGYGRKI